MILRKNEQILHTVYHHFFPYVKRLVLFSLFSILIFVLVRFLTLTFPAVAFYIYLTFFVILVAVFLYMSFIYWMDRLIITNQRLIFINWISLTYVQENEIFLKDVQDIAAFESGIIRFIPFLSNGTVVIKSSAYKVDITFEEVGKASAVKTFINKISEHDKK